jgi:AraC-like DNA-binding protein
MIVQADETVNDKTWCQLWHHQPLKLNLLQAFHSRHAYPRHSHDYYVVAVVDQGLQSFTYAGSKYITPVDGIILLNPGDVHTGEPVDEHGFGYRAFYPTVQHMETAMLEFTGRRCDAPSFSAPRADDVQIAGAVRALHYALKANADPLECESRFLCTLIEIIKQFGDRKSRDQRIGHEHQAVQRARDYIHENYDQPLSLTQLAEQVHFSRYYLVHTFRDEIGMPPHTYLESVRIRQAQKLLSEGKPLAHVAHQVGFGSQSHFTQRFKQIIGVTPGEYAKHLNP